EAECERWQTENAPSQSAQPPTRIPRPAREKFKMTAAVTIAKPIPQKIQRLRPFRKSSWAQARTRIPVKPTRFPVWLRFEKEPKLRSLCKKGGDFLASKNKMQTAASERTPATNRRAAVRTSLNPSRSLHTR